MALTLETNVQTLCTIQIIGSYTFQPLQVSAVTYTLTIFASAWFRAKHGKGDLLLLLIQIFFKKFVVIKVMTIN